MLLLLSLFILVDTAVIFPCEDLFNVHFVIFSMLPAHLVIPHASLLNVCCPFGQ